MGLAKSTILCIPQYLASIYRRMYWEDVLGACKLQRHYSQNCGNTTKATAGRDNKSNITQYSSYKPDTGVARNNNGLYKSTVDEEHTFLLFSRTFWTYGN